MTLKELLYQQCISYTEKRANTITTTIKSHQNALSSETKSSAGDKHETGRAMLQLEMEKAGQQLYTITQMKEILAKIDPSKKNNIAHLGSIISTNIGNYFLSISAGILQVHTEQYFAISISSPIGKLLLGKKVNDDIIFNNKKLQIIAIT